MIKNRLLADNLQLDSFCVRRLSVEEEFSINGGTIDEEVALLVKQAGKWCGSKLRILIMNIWNNLNEEEKKRLLGVDVIPTEGYDQFGCALA